MVKAKGRKTVAGEALEKGLKKYRKSEGTVWKGPEEDGLTQSLFSKWLVCRERFRLLTVEGLDPADRFSHRLHYGQMWHECEEAIGKGGNWKKALEKYCNSLSVDYPESREEIQKWWQVCATQFPIYVKYWKKHVHVKKRKNLASEVSFAVPYSLPSGRVVRLRGKWDSVDAIGTKLYLQENKTKGEIDEEQLQNQLNFDLQTMFYLVAIISSEDFSDYGFPSGVRYNVVRRPLSGGKHTIRPHKGTAKKPAETSSQFYSRLGGLISEDPEFFFMRWTVDISTSDILKFEDQFLIPALEELCDWWSWIEEDPMNPFREGNTLHHRSPFGVYNALAQGRPTELDNYLNLGSMSGLQRTSNLFPEL